MEACNPSTAKGYEASLWGWGMTLHDFKLELYTLLARDGIHDVTYEKVLDLIEDQCYAEYEKGYAKGYDQGRQDEYDMQ